MTKVNTSPAAAVCANRSCGGPNTYNRARSFLLIVAFSFFFYGSTAAFGETAPSEKGKELFNAKCTPCHSIGGGKKVGPDLKGITDEMPKKWLEDFIADPDEMFEENDPAAVRLLREYKIKMPDLGLSKEDVSAILAFLATQKGEAAPTASAPGAPGDASMGRNLFTGTAAFKNGGPPCISCHSVTGAFLLGGGTLGPDLTRVYSSLGSGIVSVLTTIPFPTMVPVFRGHPLAQDEVLDLEAFLSETVSSQPRNFTPYVVIIAIIGSLVLLAAAGLIWRRRLVSVREEMVRSARKLSGGGE